MKQYKDHLGNTYNNTVELCDAYGIDVKAYRNRLYSNWTQEKALTTPLKVQSKDINDRTDHKGNVYDSIVDMCKAYNMQVESYRSRIRKKWTKEKALTWPIISKNDKVERTDHLGNVYKTKKEMCNFYNINLQTFARRKKQGWNIEKILTTPIQNRERDISEKTDHLGRIYKSVYDMCKAYNISVCCFDNRLRKKWTMEKILTTPTYEVPVEERTDCYGKIYKTKKELLEAQKQLKNDNKMTIYDHLGNVFESEKAMCKFYNIKCSTYRSRKKEGWTDIEKILTTPTKNVVSDDRIDYLGNIYKTKKDMCRAYGISVRSYSTRRNAGYTVEESLTMKFDYKNKYLMETQKMDCGLKATIIKYVNSKNIDVKFEDGQIKKAMYGNFKKGAVKHPSGLSGCINRTAVFHDFTTLFAFKEDDKVYYNCKCNKCGMEDILTPQDMLKHKCNQF